MMSKVKIRAAIQSDCPQLLDLIRELAVYEKAGNEVSLTLEQLEVDGFGADPAYRAFVAEEGQKLLGMALFYEKYSTWKGRSLYLEDFYIRPTARGKGIGRALFERLIQEAKRRGSARMEWQVLKWNQPAIRFYQTVGAELDGEWLNGRLSKEQLNDF